MYCVALKQSKAVHFLMQIVTAVPTVAVLLIEQLYSSVQYTGCTNGLLYTVYTVPATYCCTSYSMCCGNMSVQTSLLHCVRLK
jgi:hypothetical protein